MLLNEVVATTETVASTSSRLAKIDALAAAPAPTRARRDRARDRLPDRASPRQGRIGVGWRGVATLEVAHADDAEPHGARRRCRARPAGRRVRCGLGRRRGAESSTTLAARATAPRVGLRRAGDPRRAAHRCARGRAAGRDRAGVRARPAPTVRRAAMLSGDLGETARLALTGDRRRARRGRPRRRAPGACRCSRRRRRSVAEAVAAVAGEASVEFKLDGARIQVHRVRRRRARLTRATSPTSPHRVPEIVEVVRALPLHDVILDGETLSLDEDGGPRPFQDTMARFGAEAHGATVLRPWFFDVLHVDGRDLIDEPLAVRLAELERIAAEWRIPGVVTADPEAAERALARGARRRARGRRGQGDRLALCRRATRARAGSRSSPCSPTTSSCSPSSGARGGAPDCCRTCTSGRSTRRASSARPADSSWSARRSRG